MPDSDESAPADPLEPLLRDVEAQLRRRLHEACEAEANGVVTESTTEIRRLEDSLLAAAVAAEQAITLRRHIDRRKAEGSARGSSEQSEGVAPELETGAASIGEPAERALRVREFRDTTGQLWRAWPVTPGLARHSRTAERYLGEFHKGWICFESLEGPARRRLPQQPAHWTELRDAELVELLERAITAPQRRPKAGPDKSPPRSMH
jgi:hypothetical protein